MFSRRPLSADNIPLSGARGRLEELDPDKSKR